MSEINLMCDKNREEWIDNATRPIDFYYYVEKEDPCWNFGTYHLKRSIGVQSPKEKLWIKTQVACSARDQLYAREVDRKVDRKYRLHDIIYRAVKVRKERKTYIIVVPVDSRGKGMWIL